MSEVLACLARNLPGRVIEPGAEQWRDATRPYNTRLEGVVAPIAVVYAQASDDISQAVTCATISGAPVVARSGGHSYAAYSLGGSVNRSTEQSLVVDLRGIRHIEYDARSTRVKVGSGAMLGELINALALYGRNVPSGSCPTVGVGGQALAGGFGSMSRSLGLLLDNVVEAEMVLADGRAVTVNVEEHPDLYWAIRGAGPSFGIVHSLTFITHHIPLSIIYFGLTLEPRRMPFTQESIDRASRLYQVFEDFGESEDNVPDWGMSWHVTPEGDGSKVEVIGQFSGGREEFERVMERFEKRLRDAGEDKFIVGHSEHSESTLAVLKGFIDAAHQVGGNWTRLEDRGELNTNEHENFYAKSILTKRRIPSSQMMPHLTHLLELAEHPTPDIEWFVLAPYLGGRHSAITRGDSAFAHRDVRTVWELYAKNTGNEDVDLVSLVEGLVEGLPVDAVYSAYVDERIAERDYPRLIWGDSYPRLQAIKAEYDPMEVFRFPQSVRPRTGSHGMIGLAGLWVLVLVGAVWRRRSRRSSCKPLRARY